MASRLIREPQFHGSFYPSSAEKLTHYLERVLLDERDDGAALIKAQGCFVPHAGYMYSGECAARTLARIEVPDNVILLHTKHTPQGRSLAISPHDAWRTPIAITPVARELADALNQHSPARYDAVAEEGEHAGEVVLPFLQMLNSDLRVCVISVANASKPDIRALGEAIAKVTHDFGESDVLIVASTDMNHYESKARTQKLDDIALEQMEKLDPDGLLDAVKKHSISMCGAAATAAMMHACIKLGCKELVVVDHTDSSETSGDFDEVVGYASGYMV